MGLINLGTNYREAIEKSRKRDEAILKDKERFHYNTGHDNSDILSNLIPVSVNGTYFPVSQFTTDLSYAVVEHKYPHKDSARLEMMGRNPMEIHVTAPLVNTIVPGPTDKWIQGYLFPSVYIKLFTLSTLQDTVKLTHPLYGEIKCKILSFNTDIDAKFRGGVIVNMVFKETIDEIELDSIISIGEALQNLPIGAKTLDLMMLDLEPSPTDLGIPEYKKSLFDAVNDITNMVNAPGQFAGKLVGAIDSLEGRVQTIITKISQTYSTSWGQANNLAYKLKADIKDLKKLVGINIKPNSAAITNQSNTNRNIGNETNLTEPTILVYVTEKKSVFTNLAGRLNNTYKELITLNPLLASKAYIPINTNVRYYQK